MSFEAAFTEGPPRPAKGPGCTVSHLIAWLPSEKERGFFQQMLADPHWRHVDIVDAYNAAYLKKVGKDGELVYPHAPNLSTSAVSRHRKRVYDVGTGREACACELTS